MFKYFSILFTLMLFFVVSPLNAEARSTANYELAISFDIKNNTLRGTAHISLPPGQNLNLSLQGIDVTGISINRESKETLTINLPSDPHLSLPSSQGAQELFISYTMEVKHSYYNRIGKDGIVLTSGWYPQPDQHMYFTLHATVPKGFLAIAESDTFSPTQNNGVYRFSLSQQLAGIHFIAGPYTQRSKKIREGLTVHTLFFDDDLAAEYLEATSNFITRYESLIGPFPYNHYTVVENHLPTGFGMPTFTLLGSSVIRLPFIKETSLGHEVLHSWFGNSVGVNGGNWCEGLTSYLADWTFKEEKGEGKSNRKEQILKYMSYVHPNTARALKEFNSASHLQPMANAIRAIGYTRGAFLFHGLKQKIGEKQFYSAIQTFYSNFKGKSASWQDIQKIFKTTSGQELDTFFQQQLSRKDIPHLSIESASSTSNQDGSEITLTLLQKTEKPFDLEVEIVVTTIDGDHSFRHTLSSKQTTATFKIPSPPLSVSLDPAYHVLRQLDSAETPPIWSQFLGAKKKLILLSSKESGDIYKPLLQRLQKKDWKVTYADKVDNKDLSDASLLFLGSDSTISRTLFGQPQHPQNGFTLEVRTHPLNNSHVAVLVSSESRKETAAVVHKLPHYGKYSHLFFTHGRIQKKSITKSSFGHTVEIEKLPLAGSVSQMNTFGEIVQQLENYKVIYVGETHTSYGDHILQYRLIQALHQQNPALAIGMEMFPRSSQKALDQYVLHDKNMSEVTFLKQSKYFDVWRYDWRFFRDIFTYARKHSIPIVGLNLDRSIVSSVFKNGNTDNLTEEQQKSLPMDRDLSLPGYQERLDKIFGTHLQGGHGKGMKSGFIQAQALWDETMAETIANYIKVNPEVNMVVLAGSQHTRKDSGIPPRVARRVNIPQASVLSITNTVVPEITKTIDYVFMTEERHLPPAAKIGIVLTTVKENDKEYLKITEVSPHGHAKEAGLLPNDILLNLNGHDISNMTDVKIAMIDARQDDIIPLVIKREADSTPLEKQINVRLYSPQAKKPHP